jgi:hypothetical protein
VARKRSLGTPLVAESVWRLSEREPVQVPADVLEGLEAVRRYTGTGVLDVATVRLTILFC